MELCKYQLTLWRLVAKTATRPIRFSVGAAEFLRTELWQLQYSVAILAAYFVDVSLPFYKINFK